MKVRVLTESGCGLTKQEAQALGIDFLPLQVQIEDKTYLDGVSFEIQQGEFVIIAGASGAGKSTILNLLGGMDTVSEGRIIVDGREISSYKEKDMTLYRRYDVGFVFQFYNLVQNLTLRENVELATQICKKPLDIDETIELVGLKDRMFNFPSQLSGGEQQRVAIARALAKNPKLGKETIAEGVETEQQLDYLREVGCDAVQGFVFDKPLPAADFEKRLACGYN